MNKLTKTQTGSMKQRYLSLEEQYTSERASALVPMRAGKHPRKYSLFWDSSSAPSSLSADLQALQDSPVWPHSGLNLCFSLDLPECHQLTARVFWLPVQDDLV